MEKLERDGKVAVVYSRGHGAGWSTWSDEFAAELCMDAEITQAVVDGDNKKAAEIAARKYPGVYTGGASSLRVEWVEKGKRFEVMEYDGDEGVRVIELDDFLEA